MARPKMSDYIAELAQKAQYAFDSSRDYYTQIDQERNAALSFFMQLPQGNEVEGFSSYRTSDVRDTVKWAQAQLMDMFYGGDAPVRFDPRNEGDVDQAEIETNYVKYVIEEQNAGFLTINTWFKDALIQKNGVVRCYWDDTIDEQPEEYENKDFTQYSLLLEDKEFKVTKVKVHSDLFPETYSPEEFAAVMEGLPPEIGMQIMQDVRFDIKGKRVKDIRQVRIENIAPENFIVDRSQISLDLKDTAYCAERQYITRAECVSRGYDYNSVMELPLSDLMGTNDTTSTIRYTKESGRVQSQSSATRAGEVVEIVHHYIRDFEGKEPKLWCIITGANGTVVFDYYEVDRPPFHVITPEINPYRYYGDSLADELVDIQYAHSNLMRAGFDNIKFSVIPRWLAQGDIDLDAAVDHTAGQVVTGGPDASLTPLTTPFVAAEAMNFAKELESQRAERTGFSKETAGLDPSALADSTNMMGSAILNLSQTRVKMIASTFANTGYKTLCEHVRELLYKYEDRDRVLAIAGKFATVKPRDWFQSRTTTVKAGLGYAGKTEQLAALQNVMGIQEKLAAAQGGLMGPMVTLDNVYNTISRMLQASGIKDVSTFFTNPEGYQPPPPEKPLAEKQLESYERSEMYKADVRAATELKKADLDANLGIYQTDKDTQVKQQELIYKYQTTLKADLDNQLKVSITKDVEVPENED